MKVDTQRKRVVITGGSGMVGSRLMELLNDRFEFFNASLEEGIDLLDDRRFHSFLDSSKPEVILHLAAFTNVAEAEKQCDDTGGSCYQLNVALTKKIADYCASNGVHLVYISTDYVFDGKENRLLTEEDNPNPINWYGKTKYLGELAIQESGCKYTIARIASPYGATTGPKEDYIQKIARGIREESLYPMFTDQIITPTFIDDMARAMKEVITHPEISKGETYHVVGNESMTPYEIAITVARTLGSDYVINEGSLEKLSEKEPQYATLFPQYLKISNKRVKCILKVRFSEQKSSINRVIN